MDEDDKQGTGGMALAPGVVVERGAVRFSASRSSGPGGQNVNRRATKAELRISLEDLPISRAAIARLRKLAGKRIVGSPPPPPPPPAPEDGSDTGPVAPVPEWGELVIVSEEHRTQHRNKEACLERLRELLIRAMTVPKRRKKTKPSRGARERRMRAKREQGEKKQRRRPPED